MAQPGSISVAVDRLEKKALVKRKTTADRRVRLVELTTKGRALITKTFREHAAAMEEAASVLSTEERPKLLRLRGFGAVLMSQPWITRIVLLARLLPLKQSTFNFTFGLEP